MNKDTRQQTVQVPREVLESMLEAYQKWEEFSDEFEDFVLSSDQEFVKKMERARKEHMQGKTRDLQELKQELR